MYAFSGIAPAPAPASEPLGPGCVCPGGTVWAATPQRGPGQPPNICVRAPGADADGPLQAFPACPGDKERAERDLAIVWALVVGGVVAAGFGAIWLYEYLFERGG